MLGSQRINVQLFFHNGISPAVLAYDVSARAGDVSMGLDLLSAI